VTTSECELVDFLRAGGPRQMPLRTCCVVALITRAPSVSEGAETADRDRWPFCALIPTPEPVP
jgi:hypothetical protein